MTEAHVVTITELPDGVYDWECSCLLIAGHDLHDRDEAARDAVVVHERQDGGRFALAGSPVQVEACRNRVTLLAQEAAQ